MAFATKITYWYTKTGVLAREIALKRTMILSSLGIILAALNETGIIPLGFSDSITGIVSGGILVVGAFASALWTRQGVTTADPDLNPVSKNGVPMVEIEYAGRHRGEA